MDNFMDKLAQKFNTQDVIKANSQAEAAEMKRLQLQIAEYEKILQEMRKLNYKNVELTDKIDAMMDANTEKLQQLQDAQQINLNLMQDITAQQQRVFEEDCKRREEEAKEKEAAEEAVKEEEQDTAESTIDQEVLEGFFRRSDEFMHKENIKVYRNVQAVVIEELKAQTEALYDENHKLFTKLSGLTVMQIITLILLFGSIILNIIQIL